MKTVIVFGILVEEPDGIVKVISLSPEYNYEAKDGGVEKNHWLGVTFLIGKTLIEKRFLIAKGAHTSGWGNGWNWLNKKLFKILEKEEFSEEKKTELVIALKEMYEAGEVKEKAMRKKIDEMFGVK